MPWTVEFCDEFEPEFSELLEEVQNELLSNMVVLKKSGPSLGRPVVGTLTGSKKYSNLKELRFNKDNGVWRFLFAFAPNKKAIIFNGGNKSGKNEARFYKNQIKIAEKRFKKYLEKYKEEWSFFDAMR